MLYTGSRQKALNPFFLGFCLSSIQKMLQRRCTLRRKLREAVPCADGVTLMNSEPKEAVSTGHK